MKHTLASATLIAGLAAGTTFTADAATLTDFSTVAMQTALGPVGISFTPGSEGFTVNNAALDNPINAQGFNNPVYAYGIYGAAYEGTGGGLALSGGAPIIGVLENADNANTYADIWTTSPTTGPADTTGLGTRSITGSNATIDISGLDTGSLYIFHGRWQGGTSDNLDVVMSGVGQTDVTLTGAGQTAVGTTGTLHWATRIDFDDAADYDSITFTHNISTGGGYMIGAVVTKVPEPGSLALLGLGGLCMLRRRRG